MLLFILYLKVGGALHHGVGLVHQSWAGVVEENIDSAVPQVLWLPVSNGGEEQAFEVVAGETHQGAKNEAFGVFPANATKSLETEPDLVSHSLKITS